MAAALALALLKLALGIAAFALLGYLGRFHDKRIAGVLLTFPILNGIGILTGADALAVANSIYVVVVVNGLLLFIVIAGMGVLPPLPRHLPADLKLAARLVTWTFVWAAGAGAVVIWRDRLPGPGVLFVLQCALATIVAALWWKAPRHHAAARTASMTVAAHTRVLMRFWSTPAGRARMALFTVCCIALLAVAAVWDSKWVGMVSALPLPGLFAVATLSVLEERTEFAVIGDSVLFGPAFVIAFNFAYAHIVVRLSGPAHTVVGLTALIVLLAINAALIFWIVPRISAYLDARRKA